MNPQSLDPSSRLKSRSHAVALIISDISTHSLQITPAVEEQLGIDGLVVLVGNSSGGFSSKKQLCRT
jgi:hypothetical protein